MVVLATGSYIAHSVALSANQGGIGMSEERDSAPSEREQ